MFLSGLEEKLKKIVPIWFNWLGWFLALGAMGYIAEKTKNIGLQIIYGISFIVFFNFITITISDIMKFKVVRSQKINNVLTLIIALGVLAITTIILRQGIEGLLNN